MSENKNYIYKQFTILNGERERERRKREWKRELEWCKIYIIEVYLLK